MRGLLQNIRRNKMKWILMGIFCVIVITLGVPFLIRLVEKNNLKKEVAYLIDETTKTPDAEAIAFSQLEALGERAVPEIVSHLSDERPLADHQIVLKNKFPGAFEAVRMYTPRVVHDGLSALLSQMTGKEFHVIDIDNSSSEMRQKNRIQWVTWCRNKYQDKAGDCGNVDIKNKY